MRGTIDKQKKPGSGQREGGSAFCEPSSGSDESGPGTGERGSCEPGSCSGEADHLDSCSSEPGVGEASVG